MAKEPKQHKQVGEEYMPIEDKAPDASHVFPYPPEVVWAALLDGPAWTEWLPLEKVTWTSPQPFGVGTTRTVEAGGVAIEETFYAWEEGKRMAFRFERSPLPVSAAAEDYQVVPAEGGSELRWWGKASGFPLGFLVGRQLRSGLKKNLPELEKLIAKDPARFGG